MLHPDFYSKAICFNGSGNLENLIKKVLVAKTIPNVLGAKAHFSTTRQFFSNSSAPKKNNIVVIRILYFFRKKHIFLPKNVGGTQSSCSQNGKSILQA